MSDTEKLALRAPAEKPFKSGDGKFWIFTTVDGKKKLSCFDGQLVAAFEQAKLEGVEHEYRVRQKEGKDDQLVEILGVYKQKGSGGGYRPTGPMLTDRQVALLAAVVAGAGATPSAVIHDADLYAAWLSKPGPAGAPAPPSNESGQRRNKHASRNDSAAPAHPATPASPGTLRRVRKELERTGASVRRLLEHYGVEMLERLTEAQAVEATARLEAKESANQAARE